MTDDCQPITSERAEKLFTEKKGGIALRQHCEAEGRDYDAIEKTCAFAFDVGEDGSKVGDLIGQRVRKECNDEQRTD